MGSGDLRHEGVGVSTEGGLEGPCCRWKVGIGEVVEGGLARHVGIALAVHSDAATDILVVAAKVTGVDEGGARGIEHRHEGVGIAAEGRLEGPRRCWEAGGTSETRHVGVARGVHSDILCAVVGECAPGGVVIIPESAPTPGVVIASSLLAYRAATHIHPRYRGTPP